MTTHKNTPEWKPRKKKKRKFRQTFARMLQHIAPERNGTSDFSGPLGSVAILAQEKLGDCVLLTPLIRILRKNRPDLKIHIIAFSRISAGFFQTDPDVTAVHHVKRQYGNYRREVLSRTFDVLFNTKDHPSTHFLMQSVLIKARYKVGHKNEFHEGLFDRLLSLEFSTHMALKNCALLDLLGIRHNEEDCRPSLAPQPLSSELTSYLKKFDDRKITGINISAGEKNRIWPATKWITLINQFPERPFIVLSGPDEHEEKKIIEQSCRNIIASPRTRNLYEVLCIVEKLELLITPDTSLIHIASAAKTPVVGLYREAPQDISRFGPFRIPCKLVISGSGEVSGIEINPVIDSIRKLASSSLGNNPEIGYIDN